MNKVNVTSPNTRDGAVGLNCRERQKHTHPFTVLLTAPTIRNSLK